MMMNISSIKNASDSMAYLFIPSFRTHGSGLGDAVTKMTRLSVRGAEHQLRMMRVTLSQAACIHKAKQYAKRTPAISNMPWRGGVQDDQVLFLPPAAMTKGGLYLMRRAMRICQPNCDQKLWDYLLVYCAKLERCILRLRDTSKAAGWRAFHIIKDYGNCKISLNESYPHNGAAADQFLTTKPPPRISKKIGTCCYTTTRRAKYPTKLKRHPVRSYKSNKSIASSTILGFQED
jgi:hypothetical protein